MTKKLKHLRTRISSCNFDYFAIISHFKVLKGKWNNFSSLEDAENYLISHYKPSANRDYGIVTRNLIFDYK